MVKSQRPLYVCTVQLKPLAHTPQHHMAADNIVGSGLICLQ